MERRPKTPKILDFVRGKDLNDVLKALGKLDPEAAEAVLGNWELWRLPYQALPEGHWRRWVFRAGRGTGKTHTGARTTNEVAMNRKLMKHGEVGIIGRTHADARFTMVEGSSGILATAPRHMRPRWEPGNGLLTWPNGVKGRIFSADKPESMRGTNWAWVWGDEPAHWPNLGQTWWEVIEPALRIGWARAMLTTTPIPASDLKDLEDKWDSVTTRGSTFDNIYLKQSVRDALLDHYKGTRIGRQELEGEYLNMNENALWDQEIIDQHRVDSAPDLRRVVVAVDPAVTANENSDETGIVVAGMTRAKDCYVLETDALKVKPSVWARRVVGLYKKYKADAVVVEVNNGGDLLEATIQAYDPAVNVINIRATRGKVLRAEPVAAHYERGKVHHVGHFPRLEEQQTTWDPIHSDYSPDLLDAVVWAITELAINGANTGPIQAYL